MVLVGIGELLRTLKSQVSLVIENCKISSKNQQILLCLVSKNSHVQGITMQNCEIDFKKPQDDLDNSSNQIIRVLRRSGGVKHLNLSQNWISIDGAFTLSQSLVHNFGTLQTLDLTKNQIGPKGMRLITEAFKIDTT